MPKETVDGISAILLTRYGEDCRVQVEIGGKWYEVIHDNQTFISHIVEAAGIKRSVDNGPTTR